MPITTSWKGVAWKTIISVVVSAVLLFCGYVGFMFWLLNGGFGRVTTDHDGGRGDFYESRYTDYFSIPDEAQITSGMSTGGWLGRTADVKFRLPKTKSPEQWLAEIAEASGLAEYREHKYAYDAGRKACERSGREKKLNTYRLEYTPSTDGYSATWGWD